MAWARPRSPVSTARSGRTIGRGRNRRSSRRSRGSSPARRNDDFPAPDGPRITNKDFTPVVRIPCSTSRPPRIWASRPKNTAASASSSGAHPRYGARSGSPGGGHAKCSAPMPRARKASSSRCRATRASKTGSPPSAMSISEVGPWSGNRSQRCHSEVMLVSGHRLQPGAQDGLVEALGVAVLRRALMRAVPMLRQQADHRLAAGVGLVQRLLPPLAGPNAGVRVQIKEDFLGQARLLPDQPLLDRHRLTAIPAGMTQEHPRHNSPPKTGIRLTPGRSRRPHGLCAEATRRDR